MATGQAMDGVASSQVPAFQDDPNLRELRVREHVTLQVSYMQWRIVMVDADGSMDRQAQVEDTPMHSTTRSPDTAHETLDKKGVNSKGGNSPKDWMTLLPWLRMKEDNPG